MSATEDPIPKVDLSTIEVTVVCQMFILRFHFSHWGPDTQGGPVDYRGDSGLSDVYIEVISATEDPIPKVDLSTREVTVVCQMFILRFHFSHWGPDYLFSSRVRPENLFPGKPRTEYLFSTTTFFFKKQKKKTKNKGGGGGVLVHRRR